MRNVKVMPSGASRVLAASTYTGLLCTQGLPSRTCAQVCSQLPDDIQCVPVLPPHFLLSLRSTRALGFTAHYHHCFGSDGGTGISTRTKVIRNTQDHKLLFIAVCLSGKCHQTIN